MNKEQLSEYEALTIEKERAGMLPDMTGYYGEVLVAKRNLKIAEINLILAELRGELDERRGSH